MDRLLSIVLLLFGVFNLIFAAKHTYTGKIKHTSYSPGMDREKNPKAFWRAITLNAFAGILCIGFSLYFLSK